MFHCTSLYLPQGAAVRESARPVDLRQPDYNENFDATTLFYDIVALTVPRKSLLFVGPPLLNLLPLLYQSRLNGRQFETIWWSYYARDRCCDVWVQMLKDGDTILDTPFGSFQLSPQTAEHHLYAGKRVLYTLSKDNEIPWIIDWIQFHAKNHGANAVLLYDNASSSYSGQSLEEALRDKFPKFEINVVHWPYKYGPQGVSAEAGWDSDFCQAGAFQDARFRFLASAASVLNCDVDELVVAPRGRSVFEATECVPGGYITFTGRWVSNAFQLEAALPSGKRHGQFLFVDRDDSRSCPTKWCVVPSQCPMGVHWSTHLIHGKDSDASHTSAFSYRHFRGISTNWKYQRYWPESANRARHRYDTRLASNLACADMVHYRSPSMWSTIVRHFKNLAHPDSDHG